MDLQKQNRLLNEDEIRAGALRLASMPRRLIVTLSTRCNAKCIMCEVRKNTTWDVPAKTIDEIVSLLPYLESVIWQGGEVFFLDFFERLFTEACRYPNLKQTLVSNAMLLDARWAERLTTANVELAISVDGTTKDVYEKIRFGSNFDTLCRNLATLNEARRRNASPMTVRLHNVVMRSNWHQVDGYMDFARSFGFNAVHMMPIWGGQDIDENIFLHRDTALMSALGEKLAVAERKAREYGIEFLNSLPAALTSAPAVQPQREVPAQEDQPGRDGTAPEPVPAPAAAPVRKDDGLMCYLPWQQLNIDPGGLVRPGCLCTRPSGSVLENSILELWNGPDMLAYREKVLSGADGWCNQNCLNGSMPMELRRV